jgi:hypothetical protein
MELPAFLNYYGDCSLGNHICTNNELIANNSSYCNLTIPVGVTAKVSPAVTTVIYVRDTLFLNGTLSGIGLSGTANSASSTSNHMGATGSGGNGQIAVYPIQASSFIFSWTPSNQPTTLTGFGGSISISGGGTGNSNGYCEESSSGNNLTADILKKIIHFGLDISGGNGAILTANYSPATLSGQGGGGIYFIARVISFGGIINLNGGNGIYYVHPSYSNQWVKSGGGGGGSCVLRTTSIISSTGVFSSVGGIKPDCGNGLIKGGDGAMIIVTQ